MLSCLSFAGCGHNHRQNRVCKACWGVIELDTNAKLALVRESHFEFKRDLEGLSDAICDTTMPRGEHILKKGNHLHVIHASERRYVGIMLLPEAFIDYPPFGTNADWPGMADSYGAKFELDTLMEKQMAWLTYETSELDNLDQLKCWARYKWLLQLNPLRQVFYLQEVRQAGSLDDHSNHALSNGIARVIEARDSTIITNDSGLLKVFRWDGQQFRFYENRHDTISEPLKTGSAILM